MKFNKGLVVLVFWLAMFAPGAARAERFGHEDSHHEWHDAGYWHERHPDWVYRYHPDWVVERQEWWEADHRDHPEWFASPFWDQYPVWTYGDYDEHHVWHYAGWWHERNPDWFYAHHPGWAEAYPGWMRGDHERHPEWFHGGYWQEHHHDWNHPDEAYRHALERSNDFQREHARGHTEEFANREGHGESGVKPHGLEPGYGARPPGQHAVANNQALYQSTPQQHSAGAAPAPSFHPSVPGSNHAASGGGQKSH